MYVSFDSLPDSARIWIFPITCDIDEIKAAEIEQDLKSFVQDWTSHSVSLKGSAAVFENQFAVVAVDENTYGASGCSIDKLMRFIQNLESDHNISLLFKHKIFVKLGSSLKAMTIPQIKEAIANGELNSNHLYFDIMVDNKAKLKTEWLKPLAKGWLAKRIMN